MSLLISTLAARCVPFAFLATMTLLGVSGNPVLEVSQTRTISASPAAVWAVIGEFCDIRRWHRQARACALFHDEGQIVRSIDLRDIGTVVEVQLDRDEDAMTYSYTLVRSPWPVKQYRASLTVTPMGQGTVVVWRATFRLNDACDEGAVARIEDLFRSGLADVAREVTR
jgi:hypothetical protein